MAKKSKKKTKVISVKQHARRVPVSKKNPAGLTIVDKHSRYIDGKFLSSFGKVGADIKSEVAQFSVNPSPFPFVLSNKTNHVLAIRFSNFHREKSKKNSFNLGSLIVVSASPLTTDIESS